MPGTFYIAVSIVMIGASVIASYFPP